MDKKEFALFASALRTYFPKENILPNPQAMELWFRELADIPFPVAEAVLRKWVATNKWSPSIAEIREMTASMVYGEQMTWGEAWEKALDAVRRYGSYNKEKALDSLDPLTRKCVENIGFLELCRSENIMVERAHFQRIYEVYAKRELTEQRLPASLVQAIGEVKAKRVEGGFLKLGRIEAPKENNGRGNQ